MSRSFRLTEQSSGQPVRRALEARHPPSQQVPVAARGRRRRRWPSRLLATIVVLGGLFVAASLFTRALAERELASVVRSRTGAQQATVTIGPWWWLADLLGAGSVSHVRVSLREVPAGRLDLTTVVVDATGVRVDRGALFSQRKVRFTGIHEGKVTATISAADLTRLAGRPVVISGSTVEVTEGSATVPVAVSVSASGVLAFAVRGITLLRVPLAATRIIPPCPMHLVVSRSAIGVSCDVSPVPASVIAAMH